MQIGQDCRSNVVEEHVHIFDMEVADPININSIDMLDSERQFDDPFSSPVKKKSTSMPEID